MSTVGKKCLPFLAAVVALCILWSHPIAFAQSSPAPSSVLPTGGGQGLIDPTDSVMLLLDHQSGLFQTVKDISIVELRNNTIMLAKLATLMKIPVITTASEPKGPNGPLMPEIQQFAPHAVYVGGKGEVNAWDNEDFVRAVRATGRRLDQRLRDVPGARCAKIAGFKVYAVIDASDRRHGSDRLENRHHSAPGRPGATPSSPRPGRSTTAAELRASPDAALAKIGINEVINHYDRIIRALPEPPILLGHSFGGTITQHLLDRGLGVAGVVIDPAPTSGVLVGWQTIKSTFPVFFSWGSWRSVMTMSRRFFSTRFAQTVPPAQVDAT